MPQATATLFLGALLAYLLGSIPFGLVLTRLAGYGDIRRIGSGNIGATNVLRTGNRKLAILTLLLDAGKGAAAVLIAGTFGPDMAAVAAGAAFLGHVFPIWLRFKGGKGVATAGGILLAYTWPVGLLTLGTWLLVAIVSRYSSLAALVTAVLAPLYAWLVTGATRPTEVALFLAAVILLRHATNIRRLLAGEESKIKLGRS
jgi:acyl phosphate:glycerol-3-phosphate acyltransferase